MTNIKDDAIALLDALYEDFSSGKPSDYFEIQKRLNSNYPKMTDACYYLHKRRWIEGISVLEGSREFHFEPIKGEFGISDKGRSYIEANIEQNNSQQTTEKIPSADLYLSEKSKGGKKRHEKTEIIKSEVIKPMFENIVLIKGKSIKQRANKIHDLLAELFSVDDEDENNLEDKIINFSNKYNINTESLEGSATYFLDDKSDRVYKWCLDFSKDSPAS